MSIVYSIRSELSSIITRSQRHFSLSYAPLTLFFKTSTPFLKQPAALLKSSTSPFKTLNIYPFSTCTKMPSRYREAHVSTKGPGDARPSALQIIKDEGLEGKLSDKVALITGCSSGLGIETARALSATGAKVYCCVRNITKGEKALEGILEPGRVEMLTLDLNSLESVRACAKDFLSKSKQLNILINNAGIMATPTREKTEDGFEGQFGTNHLAHFLLFQLLKPALIASSTPNFNSRVVSVSSMGHRSGEVQFGNYNFEDGTYSPWKGYGQSKTANIYMANEIDRRYGSKGLHALSLHPGGIMTGLQTHMPEEVKQKYSKDPETLSYMKSPEQGAATTVYAAVSKEWEGKGGKYLEDCDETGPHQGKIEGYAAWAYDEEGEKRLWADSCKMVGIEDDA